MWTLTNTIFFSCTYALPKETFLNFNDDFVYFDLIKFKTYPVPDCQVKLLLNHYSY